MGIKKNITSIFMVPTLKVPKDALMSNGFINGYTKDIIRRSNEHKKTYNTYFSYEKDTQREIYLFEFAMFSI